MRTPYQRGADKERRIMNRARKEGKIAFRSAGSHSPIDVVIIDPINKVIQLVQSKGDSMTERTLKGEMREPLKRLIESLKYMNGNYRVITRVE